jgi:thymidine kinase
MNSIRNRTRRQYSSSLENRMAKSEVSQELKKKLKKESVSLTKEMNVEHVPIFYSWINCKLQSIDETLQFVDHNSILSINEIADHLDQRIESEARKLNKTKRFARTEAICNTLSALEWTRNIVRAVDMKYRIK